MASDSVPILGLEACNKFGMIRRIFKVNTLLTKENILIKFKDNFEGMGCFLKKYRIEIKENAISVHKPPRRVPSKIYENLKRTIDLIVEKKILEKVNEPRDWVHNLVVVEKKNKSLRLCLDPQAINQVIKREQYLIPTVEEVTSKLEGAEFFSVLDLKDGFWQVKLEKNSRKFCAFNTPFGICIPIQKTSFRY